MAKGKITYDPFGFDKKEEGKEGKEDNKDYIRHTFLIREEYLQNMRAYAYWERLSQKQLLEVMLTDFFKDKKIKPIPQ